MAVIDEKYICDKLSLKSADFKNNISPEIPHMEYKILEGKDKNDMMFSIAKDIATTDFRVVGKNDSTIWQKGWGEVYDHVKNQENFNITSLKPQYVNKHNIIRIDGEYATSISQDLMFNYDLILRKAIFYKYLSGAKKIVEFGCGTGTTQMILVELFKKYNTKLHATDWSQPALKIIDLISQKLDYPISSSLFNMLDLNGWDKLEIDHDTAILTVHAMEQLGDGYDNLIKNILAAKPKFCLHLEPMDEMYNADYFPDYLALNYHKKRNYLNGFYTKLKELEKSGKIKIDHCQRLQFGDRYHETYNILQWRVL